MKIFLIIAAAGLLLFLSALCKAAGQTDEEQIERWIKENEKKKRQSGEE